MPRGTSHSHSADCMAHGVLIGRTNRDFCEYNNTFALSPPYICTREDLDEIVRVLDNALTKQVP